MGKTALIAGSTGLIGKQLLTNLLDSDHYDLVNSISRRSLKNDHPKLNQIVTSFDNLDEVKTQLVCDDLFICLGSTIKKAGSKEKFELYDYTYPLQLANIALANGASQISIVSALGANSDSVIFYNRVKGQLEDAIMDLKYEAINILRPSLLLGEREETRAAEQMAQGFYKALGWAFIGPAKKYKAIDSAHVASAMQAIAELNVPGINWYDSDQIEAIV